MASKLPATLEVVQLRRRYEDALPPYKASIEEYEEKTTAYTEAHTQQTTVSVAVGKNEVAQHTANAMFKVAKDALDELTAKGDTSAKGLADLAAAQLLCAEADGAVSTAYHAHVKFACEMQLADAKVDYAEREMRIARETFDKAQKKVVDLEAALRAAEERERQEAAASASASASSDKTETATETATARTWWWGSSDRPSKTDEPDKSFGIVPSSTPDGTDGL
jgi:hypothetical protein